MPPSAFTILWYSLLKMASASFSLATFWRKPNSILARVPSFHRGGRTAPSSRPLKSLYFWMTWWIMYMIQVPMGSTSTCAPSCSRKLNILKLPSPSVVCAQNSPVILTMGLTRRRSISILLKLSRHRSRAGTYSSPFNWLTNLPTYSAVSLKPPRYLPMPSSSFEGTQGVGHFVHHVAAVERVEDAEEEIDIHFQAGFGVGLRQAAGLLEKEHAESIEPGVAQGEPVFGFIHAETAGSAGAGREEDVAVDDLLLGNALFFQGLQ